MAELKPLEVIMVLDFVSSNGREIVAHAEGVQELVRCKDCKHYRRKTQWCERNCLCSAFINENDFCSHGEKRSDSDE